MSQRNRVYILVLSLFCSLLFFRISAQPKRGPYPEMRTAPKKEKRIQSDAPMQLPMDLARPDSTARDSAVYDTTALDTTRLDTTRLDTVGPPKEMLQAPVYFKSADSMVLSGTGMAYMYGTAEVRYMEMQLNSDILEIDLDSNNVFAVGREDSLQGIIGSPVFKDKSGEYQAKTIRYNLNTEKGFITNIITQQGEGYLTGSRTKKLDDDSFFMRDGRYTTCDRHDCPHFYLQLTRAKITPNKTVVGGPTYMVLAGVPLPLGAPFFVAPATKKYSSGIIVPTFGDENRRGFYLRDGGYYFAFSDYIDLALTGEIYTKGSWGLNARSNYIKRYKYSGNFNLGYLVTVLGDKGLPDYSRQTNFRLAWTHTQDSKANPNMSFSASVNFTTSGYSRNDLNSYYNANSFTENTKSSTVNMTYRFPNSPFTLSTTANISQRSKDSTLVVSFPDFTVSMSRIYPFKRKNPVGNERWYEKISMNYTGTFRNSLTAKQDEFFNKSLIKDWSNGMKHSVPVSATFNVLKYINISPTFTFNDRMYTKRVLRDWDPVGGKNGTGGEVLDTTYGFYNVYDFNAGISAQTKIYGFFKPLPFLGKKVEMIRHVLTPSLSFSGAPDFADPGFGFYKSYQYYNENGELKTITYSPFSGGIYGTAPSGKTGTVSMSLANNLEMKVKSDRDSTGVRKISLIENLTANMGYNFAVDSMNWSDLSISFLIKLTKGFNLQGTAVFDTYTYNAKGQRINVPRWKAGKGIGRLRNTGTSFNYTLNNDTFKKWFGKKEKTPEAPKNDTPPDGDTENPDPNADPNGTQQQTGSNNQQVGEFDPDGYMIWRIPWSLTFNYTINYAYGTFNSRKREYNMQLKQTLGLSGTISPTKGWNASFSANYDFDRKKISYMTCSVTRDLHCWTMGVDFIPVGPFKSYNFRIAVKSALLSDLKYTKRNNAAYDRVDWY